MENTRTFDRISSSSCFGLLLLACFSLITASAAAANPQVRLEVTDPVIVNEGSITARVRIENNGDEAVSVNVPDQLQRGLQVTVGGNAVKTSVQNAKNSGKRTIEPGGFVGKQFEFTPEQQWDRPVELTVKWSHQQLGSEASTAYYFPDRLAKIDVEGYAPLYVSFYYQDAPANVFHVQQLIRNESYDGSEFHRLIKGYLLQGGADVSEGEPSTVQPEFNEHKHRLGTVSMAHGQETRTSGTEFFITLGRQPMLDGQYTVIGRVKPDSRSVLQQIEEQVKTDHKEIGGICGVDHTDAPKNPLVMTSVRLIAPENYEQESSN